MDIQVTTLLCDLLHAECKLCREKRTEINVDQFKWGQSFTAVHDGAT